MHMSCDVWFDVSHTVCRMNCYVQGYVFTSAITTTSFFFPLGQLCSPHLSSVRVFRAAFIACGSRPAQQCLGQWPPHGRRGGQHSTNTVVDFLSLHHVSVCAYVRVHVCCMYVCVLYITADRVHFFSVVTQSCNV